MTYQDIEDKIIARLKSEVPELKDVEPYAGQLEEEIKHLAVRLPAAFVVHDASTFEWIDGSSYNQAAEVDVLIAQRVDPRKGADKAVVESATEALVHQDLGLQMERLMPVRQELVFTNKLIEVRGIRFRTSFDREFKEA